MDRSRLSLPTLRSTPILLVLALWCAQAVVARESQARHSLTHWLPVDLKVYTLGGQAVSRGASLYSNDFVPGLPFTYPPFAGWVFSLFASYDPKIITIGWQTLNFLCLLAVIAMVVARHRRLTPMVCVLVLLLSVCALATSPVRGGFYFGQINPILMALVAADFLPKKGRLPGIGVGLAAGMKLTPALFVIIFVVQRRWRDLSICLATLLTTVLIGLWRVADGNDFWTDAISNSSRVGVHTNPGAQSLHSVLIRVFAEESDGLWLLSCAVVLLLTLAAVWAALQRDQVSIAVALVGIAACLVSPFSWFHHWVWIVPAAVWWLVRADDLGRHTAGLLTRGRAPRGGRQSVVVELLVCQVVTFAAVGVLFCWLQWMHSETFVGTELWVTRSSDRHNLTNAGFIGAGIAAIVAYALTAPFALRRVLASRRHRRANAEAGQAAAPLGAGQSAGVLVAGPQADGEEPAGRVPDRLQEGAGAQVPEPPKAPAASIDAPADEGEGDDTASSTEKAEG